MKHPEYDSSRYTVYCLPKSGAMLHWILNPVIALSELFLGTRLPKVILLDRTDNRPVGQRSYVPCPHCGTLHPSLLWSRRDSLGHWFGYVCPTCDKIIPCLRNWTSLLILTLTFPLWYLPVHFFKPRWLAYERTRNQIKMANPNLTPVVITMRQYMLIGAFGWGGLMWLFMCVIPFLYHFWTDSSPTIDIGPVVYGLPLCLFLGLLWGLTMHFMRNKKCKTEPAT